jgi:hypothetical protein
MDNTRHIIAILFVLKLQTMRNSTVLKNMNPVICYLKNKFAGIIMNLQRASRGNDRTLSG